MTDKPVKCPDCNKRFKAKIDMQNHYQDKHHEPSIASQMLDARLDYAMNGECEDWATEMMEW